MQPHQKNTRERLSFIRCKKISKTIRTVPIVLKVRDSYALGQIIQQSRMQQGFSQRELADMLGISQKWVWEMEQGKPGILMDRLFLILEKTGVTLFAELEAKDAREK